MEDAVARNWAVFVSEYTEDVGPAFTKATELLQQMTPDEELPFVLEERLDALKLPLPPIFENSLFLAQLEQMVKQARHKLLLAQSGLLPVSPATMDDMAAPPEVASVQNSPQEPTAQQLANALAAMAASYAETEAVAVVLLSATLAVNSFDHLTVSAADSPIKFVILEDRKAEEIYVAFPGTECWADVASDAAFWSKPTPTGRYHHGFFERASWFPSTALAEKVAAGAELFLVGHSLGGAVASVVTIEMLARHVSIPRGRVRCITAGSPLVGDSGIRKRCAQLGITDNLFHMVEPGDAVPRLLSFIGATKNFANGRSGKLREAVQRIANECCRLVATETNETTAAVGEVAGVAVETMAKLFTELTLSSFEPVGKYWLLPDREGEPCRWQPASECGLEAPSSYGEVVALMQNFRHHELARYRQTVLTTFSGRLTNRRFIPAVESGSLHWTARVDHCNVTLSNGRLACVVTGERLSLIRSILVGRQRFSVTATSLVSSQRVAVEIDNPEAQPFEAAVAPVTVVSLAAGCSFSANLPVGVSEVPLQEHGDFVAGLDVSQLLVRLFRTHLFRPFGTQAAMPTAGTDPLECLEALAGCQPIEVLYRFLAATSPVGVLETFNILGRLPDAEHLAQLGVSLGALESLREAHRQRTKLMDMRKVATEAGTVSRVVGAGAAIAKTNSLAMQLQQNAASIAAAAEQLRSAEQVAANSGAAYAAAAAAKAAADGKLAVVQETVSKGDPGTLARWLHKSARNGHVLFKNAWNGLGTSLQRATDASSHLAAVGEAVGDAAAKVAVAAEQSQAQEALGAALAGSAKTAKFAARYGMTALCAITTAWETYALYSATQVTSEGNSFTDVHQEIVSSAGELLGGYTWEVFDSDMVRGIGAADQLATIVDGHATALPPISAKKTLAELFPDDCGVLGVKTTLLKQRQELLECQSILLAAANRGIKETKETHRDAERYYAKMMDVHTYWIDFIIASLSGKTDVALARHGAASFGWMAKVVLLDNVLQPWVPLAKGVVCRKAASQELGQKLRDATSYVMESCSFEARVDLFYNGIVGAAEEHLFDNKRLYSKLCAIRKHAPHGVTWRTKPIAISTAWDAVMSEPGIVPDSFLACVTTDSQFEVACWLVSCLCVAELYDACMATYAVALMGVTSTGKSSLIRSIAVDPDSVLAGGLARHRTSVPLMHQCRPFAESQRPFFVLDMPGHTDRENRVDDGEDGVAATDGVLPGEVHLPMTNLCSSLVATLPHRLSYVRPFCEHLQLLVDKGRLAETGATKVLITKCEDVIEEALKETDAAAAMKEQLQEEVRRIGKPAIVNMTNTHYAVILNPRAYSSEDLQRLGVWELSDIHKWMSDQCDR